MVTVGRALPVTGYQSGKRAGSSVFGDRLNSRSCSTFPPTEVESRRKSLDSGIVPSAYVLAATRLTSSANSLGPADVLVYSLVRHHPVPPLMLEPTTGRLSPSRTSAYAPMYKNWVHTLLPITAWLPNYGSSKNGPLVCFRFDVCEDPQWLYGDVITGLTVAIVNIPQALSYAGVSEQISRLGPLGTHLVRCSWPACLLNTGYTPRSSEPQSTL